MSINLPQVVNRECVLLIYRMMTFNNRLLWIENLTFDTTCHISTGFRKLLLVQLCAIFFDAFHSLLS